MSLDAACFSMYSLISRRIIDFSLSNKNLAKLFAVSVLPTPVGPKNKKLPIGLFASDSPALFRLIALATAFIALSCPITSFLSVSSM